MSKLIEGQVKTSLSEFFDHNKIIPDFQHGFRNNMGVTTQMLEAINDWTISLENEFCVDVVYFDIKSAFDSINHQRLLDKLQSCGIDGKLLLWIKNFLNERSFQVKVGDKLSTMKPIMCGVPQGSVLGPLLFNCYMHDILSKFSNPDVTVKSFADDTKAYVSFDRANLDNHLKLQKFIDYFYSWCKENGLTLAVLKCHVLHLGLKNPKFQYTLSGEPISKITDSVRDLGINITPDLKWNSHIGKISRSANSNFFNILKAFKSNDPHFLVKLYLCYVRPVLEFASPIFNSDIVCNIKRIESVQRRITKSIIRRCFKSYSKLPNYEDRLAILGLEKLRVRMLKTDLIMVHRYKLGLLPKFSELKGLQFKRNRPSIFIPSSKNRIRNNFFFVRAYKRYLKLSQDLICSQSVELFKQKLSQIKADTLE